MRSGSRSQRAFSVAVGLTVVAALMPTGWLGWTSVLSAVVNVPLQPLIDVGLRLGAWIRPGNDEREVSAELRRRTDELETTRALLHGARLKIEGLEEEIGELQAARRLHQGAEINPLFARVTARSPNRPGGPVRLNAGSRHGVTPGTVAVYRGAHLIGRVADDVSRLSCHLVPITDPAIGLLEVIVLPADDPVADLVRAPRLQLVPDGTGALAGDLDRTQEVSPGDVVRLSDPVWAESAQGMIVGVVESVEPNDLQPLRNTVVVRPRFHANRVASVTLKIERHDRPGDAP